MTLNPEGLNRTIHGGVFEETDDMEESVDTKSAEAVEFGRDSYTLTSVNGIPARDKASGRSGRR
jgi:hypothetical protein